MNSDILKMLGLDMLDPAIWLLILMAVVVLLCVALLIQSIKLRGLRERIDRLTDGSDGASLETSISKLFDEQKKLREGALQHDMTLTAQARRMSTCIQKTGLIKYDAFNQMGGKLSYALALLDEEDNGVVINSVHSNDGCYSYAKEIKEGHSDIDLGTEETQALQRALATAQSA